MQECRQIVGFGYLLLEFADVGDVEVGDHFQRSFLVVGCGRFGLRP
jgi:hypothetical protein